MVPVGGFHRQANPTHEHFFVKKFFGVLDEIDMKALVILKIAWSCFQQGNLHSRSVVLSGEGMFYFASCGE